MSLLTRSDTRRQVNGATSIHRIEEDRRGEDNTLRNVREQKALPRVTSQEFSSIPGSRGSMIQVRRTMQIAKLLKIKSIGYVQNDEVQERING